MSQASKIEPHSGHAKTAPFIRVVHWAAGISWMFLFVAVLLMMKASPPHSTYMDKVLELRVRTWWDSELMQQAYYVMLAQLVVSSIGLSVVLIRHGRQVTSSYYKSLVFIFFVTLMGLGAYWMAFGR